MAKLNSSEWNQTFRRYMQLSKRDLPTVLNTKGFYIARRSTVETPRADKTKIRELARGKDPALARIINARRGKKGLPGLRGEDMKRAVRATAAARVRSVNYLKSGWIPAIKKLEPLAERRGMPRQDRSGRQFGRPKGDAIPARPTTWRCKTTIINAATTTRDKKEALIKYGQPALERAFAHEIASMKDYIERKMRGTAKSCGIKTN